MSSIGLPLVLTASLGALGALGALCLWGGFPCCTTSCAAPAEQTAQSEAATRGVELVAFYVEARSASVFAGACHFNGELMTQGGEAVLALTVESGAREGVDLGGLSAVALVCSAENLKFDGKRRSVVYVPAAASADQRAALVALLQQRSSDGLGEIVAVESVELSVNAKGKEFTVDVGERLHLEGVALPDRACCTMPELVWYEPIVPLDERVVGFTRLWRAKEPRLGLDLQRAEENSAFLGRVRAQSGT